MFRKVVIMRQAKLKSNSVRNILLIPMVAINMIIVLIFLVAAVGTQFFEILRESEASNLQRVVNNRAQRLYQLTSEISSLALGMTQGIADDTQKLYPEWDIKNVIIQSPDMANEILQASVPHLTEVLSYNRATGAFVILDSSILYTNEDGIDGGGHLAAIYLNDEDLGANHANRSDLSLCYGPKNISRELSAFLNNNWSVEIYMPDLDNDSFYRKPFEAAQNRQIYKLEQLGYWSQPIKKVDGTSVIMYTIPLLDSRGMPYGVAGVELSVPYLRNLLDINDIGNSREAFYMLAPFDAEHNMEWRIENGIYSATNPYSDASVAWTATENEREWRVNIKYANGKEAIGSTIVFPVFYPDNPYQGQNWSLMGATDKDTIFENISTIRFWLIIAVLCALVIGIICSVMVANWLSSPLVRLAGELRNIDPDDKIELQKTKITEIDALVNAMEELSSELIATGRRTLETVEMTDMPIGFFEINPVKKRVFVTDILDEWFPVLGVEQNLVSLDTWNQLYRQLLRRKSENEQNVYQYDSQNQKHWFRMKTASDANRTFGIIINITEEIKRQKRLEYERDTDQLTGLLNRQAFFARASERIQNTPGRQGVMIFADLDNLKSVNDTYGHNCGDSYIQTAAGAFSRFTHYGAVASRISGDEFAVFLHGFETREQAMAIINENEQRLLHATHTLPDGVQMKIRCSMGLAWYPQDSENLETLLRYADFAMYEAKNITKGSTKTFSLESYVQKSYIIKKNEELDLLIDENLVRYAMQPIIDIYSGSVFGYEAFMRPTSITLESPQQVLDIARTQAKLYHIERMTIFNIFEWIKQNLEKLDNKPVFYNSFPDQQLSEADMAILENKYSEIFKHTIAEVIETDRSDIIGLVKKFNYFRKCGSMLAIDDYGAGFSNEMVLLSLSPEFVKIDMSLIRGIHLDLDKQKLASNIIEYTKPRGIKVIAEGIECFEEAQTMIRLGTDYLQGYYLAMPSFELKDIDDDIKMAIRAVSSRYRERRNNKREN